MDRNQRKFRLLIAIICLQALFFAGASFFTYHLASDSQEFVEQVSLDRLDIKVRQELLDKMRLDALLVDQFATLLHNPSYNKTVKEAKSKIYVARERLPTKKEIIEDLKTRGYNTLRYWQEDKVVDAFFDDNLVPDYFIGEDTSSIGTTAKWFKRKDELLYQGISSTVPGKIFPHFVSAAKVIDLKILAGLFSSLKSELVLASYDKESSEWFILQNTLTDDDFKYLSLYLKGVRGLARPRKFETNLGNKRISGFMNPLFLGKQENHYVISINSYNEDFLPLQKFRGGIALILVFCLATTILLGLFFLADSKSEKPE